MLLHSLKNNFTAVRREVKIAHVKIGRKVGQLSLGPRIQIEDPQILMLNFTAEEHEPPSAGQELEMPSPASEPQVRERVGYAFCRYGFNRKGGPYVRSGVDNKATIGRPCGID